MSDIKPIKNIDTQDFNRAVDLANSVITTMVEMWCKNIIPNLVTDIINNEFKPIYDLYTKDFTDLADKLILQYTQNAETKEKELQDLHDKLIANFIDVAGTTITDLNELIPIATDLLEKLKNIVPIGQETNTHLQENIDKANILIKDIENIINEFNQNAQEKTDEFNQNAQEKLEELQNISVNIDKEIEDYLQNQYILFISDKEKKSTITLKNREIELNNGGFTSIRLSSESINMETRTNTLTLSTYPTQDINIGVRDGTPGIQITQNKELLLNDYKLMGQFNKPFFESKTFDNGYYIKFFDGTIIQSLVGTIDTDTITWVFHVAFKDTEYIPSSFSIVPYKPIITKERNMLSYKFDSSINIGNFLTGMFFIGKVN
ncbi:MAG: hypothetical protein ACRC0A_07750 [Chitinophagaceae bacterium]